MDISLEGWIKIAHFGMLCHFRGGNHRKLRYLFSSQFSILVTRPSAQKILFKLMNQAVRDRNPEKQYASSLAPPVCVHAYKFCCRVVLCRCWAGRVSPSILMSWGNVCMLQHSQALYLKQKPLLLHIGQACRLLPGGAGPHREPEKEQATKWSRAKDRRAPACGKVSICNEMWVCSCSSLSSE